jgi:hypothetical protein
MNRLRNDIKRRKTSVLRTNQQKNISSIQGMGTKRNQAHQHRQQ